MRCETDSVDPLVVFLDFQLHFPIGSRHRWINYRKNEFALRDQVSQIV